MLTIAVHSRSFEAEKQHYLEEVLFELQSYEGVQVVLSHFLYDYATQKSFKGSFNRVFRKKEELLDVDYMISIGGDGTLLEVLTFIQDLEIPVLGINTGRLGFLATTTVEQIQTAIHDVINGYFEIDKRTLIRLENDKSLFGELNFGLNEFAIMKRDTSSMIVVHTYIDGDYLNSYWADGLIISTPTGSTGYSLSVGGPVVVPHSRNFIISPVSPHNLTVRPLVVSDNSVISFEIEGRSKNFLVSLDSRSITVDKSVQMAVRKCDFYANLIMLRGHNFLYTLRKKLNWGLDSRN